MSTQTEMNFDAMSKQVLPTIVQRFFNFHAKHPEIYKQFKKYTKDLLGPKPNRVIGAQMIIEKIRYEMLLKEDDIEIYKINNSFTPGYARLFLQEHPRYHGLMPIKESIFDDYIDISANKKTDEKV